MRGLFAKTHVVIIFLFFLLCQLGPHNASSAEVDVPFSLSTLPLRFFKSSNLIRHINPNKLHVRSGAVLIFDRNEKIPLYEKNAYKKLPIASLTKLLSAIVIMDADQPLDEAITITPADKDRIRYSRSRVKIGSIFNRLDLLNMALVASENRAASALARTYPGGKQAFIKVMNRKAKQIGMKNSSFVDATGLSSKNVSTAKDLQILLDKAYQYPLVRTTSSGRSYTAINIDSGKEYRFNNTNRLVRKNVWDVDLSKTGYTSDSGYCLAMVANVIDRPLIMIFLNSWGKYSKYGDANRVRTWLTREQTKLQHRILKENIQRSIRNNQAVFTAD